jgi:hypothetical protein
MPGACGLLCNIFPAIFVIHYRIYRVLGTAQYKVLLYSRQCMSKYHLTIVLYTYIHYSMFAGMYVLIICILTHFLCENMLSFFLYQKCYKNNYIHLLTCIVVWRSIVVSAPSCRSSRFDGNLSQLGLSYNGFGTRGPLSQVLRKLTQECIENMRKPTDRIT